MTLYAILIAIIILATTLLPRKWKFVGGVCVSLAAALVIHGW